MEKLNQTPLDISNAILRNDEILSTKIYGFYEVGEAVISARLTFWYRLRACISSDYRNAMETRFYIELRKLLPNELKFTFILEL